jgi:hypothetical protein
LHAFYIPESVTVDRVAINVSTLGTGVARLGLYNHDSATGRPSTLISDWGTVSVTTTGVKEITISNTLTKGWYWFAMTWQTDSTTAWFYSTGQPLATPYITHMSTSSSATLTTARSLIFRYGTSVTGALVSNVSAAVSFNVNNPIRFTFRTA